MFRSCRLLQIGLKPWETSHSHSRRSASWRADYSLPRDQSQHRVQDNRKIKINCIFQNKMLIRITFWTTSCPESQDLPELDRCKWMLFHQVQSSLRWQNWQLQHNWIPDYSRNDMLQHSKQWTPQPLVLPAPYKIVLWNWHLQTTELSVIVAVDVQGRSKTSSLAESSLPPWNHFGNFQESLMQWAK